MKAEIYKNGPIGCGVQATPKWETTYGFHGGVYSEMIENIALNHEIAVVGWGTDEATGDEYWIGRNSWGTYWGTYGFFKVPLDPTDAQKNVSNLGIQMDCVAAIPIMGAPPTPPTFNKYSFPEFFQK